MLKCVVDCKSPLITENNIKTPDNININDELLTYKNGRVLKSKVVNIYKEKLEAIECLYYGKNLCWSTFNSKWISVDERRPRNENKKLIQNIKNHRKLKRAPFFKSNLGSVDEPHSYAIGALLGDGCSINGKNKIYISSKNSIIPNKTTRVISAKYCYKLKGNNYTYCISNEPKYTNPHKTTKVKCHFYNNWIEDRYAHQKIIDINKIKKWNRLSCIKLLAGLLDTDGSVSINNNRLTISWGMQAKEVIKCIKYLILSLWYFSPSIYTSKRDKYKNGPLYVISIRNNRISKMMLKEMNKELVCDRKKYKSFYNNIKTPGTSDLFLTVRLGKKEIRDMYNIFINNPIILANNRVVCGFEELNEE